MACLLYFREAFSLCEEEEEEEVFLSSSLPPLSCLSTSSSSFPIHNRCFKRGVSVTLLGGIASERA